jgi:NAD-dependent DNA ligase (contains BRCT domain type II)
LQSLPREDAAIKIRALGGMFQPSVGKNTTYVVKGQSPGKSKLDQANKLGTRIMTEDEFLRLIDV